MWTYAGTATRIGLQLVLTAMLARALGPEPFGIVGMALPVIGFVGLLVDQGLASALIQKPTITTEQIRTAFTRLLFASVAGTASCVVAAGWIAEFYREPALKWPLAVLSLVLIPAGLSAVSGALLRRELRIRVIQVINVASYGTGFGLVGLPMALAGAGLWSLVSASIVYVSVFAATSYALTRHSVRLRRGGSGGLSQFGSRAALAGVAAWFTESLPSIVVGRTLGAASLATFNAAMNISRTPATALATGGLEMLFASSARAQDSATFRQRAFMVAAGLVAAASLPAFATLALVADTLVHVLYGPRWTAAIPLLPPLALAMPTFMLASVASALIASMGRPGRDFLVQASTAALLATGVLIAIGHSLLAVTWVFFGALLFRAIVTMQIALRLLGMRWRDLARAIRTGFLLALVVPPPVYLLDGWLRSLHVHGAFVLVADAAAGAMLLAAGIALLRFTLPPETRWAIAQALRRIPLGLTEWLAPMFEGEKPGQARGRARDVPTVGGSDGGA